MRALAREESGQYLPLFGAVLFAALVLGFTFFQVGAASALKSRAQTAADAAALAGAVEIKREIEAGGLEGLPPTAVNEPLVCAWAQSFAQRNDATVTECRVELYDVLVKVQGNKEIQGDIASSRGKKAEARARSSLGVSFAGAVGGLPTGGGGGGAAGGGTNCMSAKDLAAIEEKAGVKAAPNSALRKYCGTGTNSTPDTADMQPELQVAILKAEDKLGHPLGLNSGFRTVAYQRELCQHVSGPCAPPGQSMHGFGLAFDTSDYGELAAIAASVGLCHPLPANDAVHFSAASSRECGGSAGSGVGSSGGVGGVGSALGFVTYAPKLVPWEGGDYSLPPLAGPIAPGDVAGALARIAQCESSGDPHAVGVGPAAGHYGKYQFDIPTWYSVGGTGNPADAPEAEQDRRAFLLYQQRGFQPWECASILGII